MNIVALYFIDCLYIKSIILRIILSIIMMMIIKILFFMIKAWTSFAVLMKLSYWFSVLHAQRERERGLGTTSASVSAMFPILCIAKLSGHCLVGMAVERAILKRIDGDSTRHSVGLMVGPGTLPFLVSLPARSDLYMALFKVMDTKCS